MNMNCIHPLSCGWGFAFLIENEHGLYLVDSGSPGRQDRLLRKMKAIGRVDLKLIWITHAHYDHYGSAAALRELTGAPIGVHHEDAPLLMKGQSPLGKTRRYGFLFSLVLSILNRRHPLPAILPDFTLQDGDTLQRFGLPAHILHTPGHTPGHTCLLLENGIAFSGDLIGRFCGPRLQFLAATDWGQLAGSLARLQAVQPQWIFTGHSPRPISGERLLRINAR